MFAHTLFAALLFAGAAAAQPTPHDLKKLSICELDTLFRFATPDQPPPGLGKGTIVALADTPLPRIKAAAQGLAWKGKDFSADGGMVNQWAGFKAVGTQSRLEPSWFDGEPCVVLDYPPGTPVFANARDEIRQIAPGVSLGRFYERCPVPKFKGYFVLVHGCP